MRRSFIAPSLFIALCAAPMFSFAAQPSLLVSTFSPNLSGSIPQGAQRIPMVNVSMTAPCSNDVTVTAVTLKHGGLGDTSDLLRVYALKGFSRISRVASVSQHMPSTVRFSPPLSIPKCQSASFSIVADLSLHATPGSEHHFDLLSVSANEPVTIGANKPAESINVTPHQSASVQYEFKPVTEEVLYGPNQPLARLLLSSTSDIDQTITAITFTNEGSAQNADLEHLFLQTASPVRLSSIAAQMEGRTVRIELSPPFVLQAHDSVLLELHGDIRASRSHTISWTIDQPSDVETKEGNAGH